MKNSTFNQSKKNLIVLICLCLFYSCSKENLEEELLLEIDLVSNISNDSRIIKDQYVVLLSKKSGHRDNRALEVLESLVNEVRTLPGARMKGTYKHALTGFSAKLTPAQVEKFRKDPRILSITPDRIIELEDVEVTTAVTVQEYPTWGLDRLDQREQKLDRAYSYTATGRGVNVYIMDSGIRYSHNEFEGRATLGVDLVLLYPEEEYDVNDPDLEPGNDCNGHGTHVAGTVGGKLYGVAKAVNLVSVRVFSCRGNTSASRVIQGVEWITEHAVKPAVVNMSLGGAAYEPIDIAIENSILTGINYTLAAGNGNTDACQQSPARTPSALTVGASMINNERAGFSNFGDCLDLYAPGHQIISASYLDDSSTSEKSGTSMAAPHVAGLTALYLEGNHDATPAQVHTAILENITRNAISNVPSGTTSLAHSLWENVEFTSPPHPDLMLKVYGFKEKGTNTIYLVWEPTNDPYVYIYRNGSPMGSRFYNTGEFKIQTSGKSSDIYRVCEISYNNCSAEVAPDFEGGTNFEPNKPPIAAYSYEINDMEVSFTDLSADEDGSIISWRWNFGDGYYTTAQHPKYRYKEPGTYTVELFVADNHRATSSIIKEISVGAIDGNFPPTANFSYSTKALEVQFIDSSSDSDGSITGWSWDFGDGNSSTSSNPRHTYANPGTYNVNLLVTDNDGATATVSQEVTVIINEPNPGTITLTALGYKVKGAWQTDLSWTPAGTSSKMDIYREGGPQASVDNTGTYTDITHFKGGGTLTYKVCETGTTNCSNEVTVQF